MISRKAPLAPLLEYDCKLYGGTAETLFQRYIDLGFIYPDKLQRLEPVWDSVLETWDRLLALPRNLSVVVEYDDPRSGAWATMHIWKHTETCWQVQHLAATGGALGSRAVVLALQEYVASAGGSKAVQNWFSPGNRFINRIFGSVDTLGEDVGEVADFAYLRLDESVLVDSSFDDVEQLYQPDAALGLLVEQARSPAYAGAESLDGGDLGLCALNAGYNRYGLYRSRRVYVVRDQAGIVGAALVYRSSIGINLSLLENRCELLVRPGLDEQHCARVVGSLLRRAQEEYVGFEAGYMPIAVHVDLEATVVAWGATPMRRYRQGTWLREVYLDNAQRIDRFYDRVTRRSLANRRSQERIS